MQEYFHQLYLKEDASEEDVKIAYKKLAKKFHPDKNRESNEFEEEFKIIQNAYEKLCEYFAKSQRTTKVINEEVVDNFKDNQTFKVWETIKEPIRNRYNFVGARRNIEVEHFVYSIEETSFQKTIGDRLSKSTADGIYLIIKLSLINKDKKTRILGNYEFILMDNNENEFRSSDVVWKLGIERNQTFFEKACQPNIPTHGYLVYEVPNIQEYFLELNGGKDTNGWPSYEKKIVSLLDSTQLKEYSEEKLPIT